METLDNGVHDSKCRPSLLPTRMCDAGYLGRKTGKGFFSVRSGRVKHSYNREIASKQRQYIVLHAFGLRRKIECSQPTVIYNVA